MEGEGGCCPLISLTLKKSTRTSDYQSISPLRSIYHHPFYKNLISLQNIAYNPGPEGCGGIVSSKTQFPDPSITLNKLAISKFLIDYVWVNDGRGVGEVVLSNHF